MKLRPKRRAPKTSDRYQMPNRGGKWWHGRRVPERGSENQHPTVAMIGSRGFPGQPGGVERVLEAICPRLVTSGHADVTVYCANWLDHDSDAYGGVHLRRVNGLRSKYADTISRSLIATCRELIGGSQVVHYHSIGSAPLSILPRLFGKKVVVTVHALDWQRSKWNSWATRFLRFGEWASVRFPHRTIAVGPEIKEYLEKEYGRTVTYIPNGAERKETVTPTTLEERGLEPGKFVLFVGRMVPEKGIHHLVEAFRSLPPDIDAQLALAGPIWYETEYHQSLLAMIDGDERIRFVGMADDDLLAELYSACACFALPSDVEGMSLSLLDAMAFGCSIVTSSIPPNMNLVGDAGLVFTAGDAGELRDRLVEILRDEDGASLLRMRAKERSKTFDWDTIAESWADIYDDLTEV